jgi:DNA gyrase subunit A
VNLEQEKLGGEHNHLLEEIAEYQRILSDEKNILSIIRSDCQELKRKYGDERRTEISGEEIGDINLEDLIAEETMVVSISHNGYIKRTPVSTYRAQRRGGKGIVGSKTEEEDPIRHLFVVSTHDYLLFFTNHGKVYWQKVYDLPQLSRESRGRAVVNLLNLAEGEKIASCLNVRDFTLPDHYLAMATRKGLVKKTALEAYSRPKRGGIIAINLREGDELVDVVLTKPGDELVMSSARGQAIRFRQSNARSVGRNSSGVRGIRLREGDRVVGMVVADPESALLTACELGFGKRTPFGPNSPIDEPEAPAIDDETEPLSGEANGSPDSDEAESTDGEETESTSARYPTKNRGGMGVRDIRTDRNGPVIGVISVRDDDELLMMSARGKIQRVAVREIRSTGRNTHGVRIMSLEEGDTLAAIARVPPEEISEPENPPVAS